MTEFWNETDPEARLTDRSEARPPVETTLEDAQTLVNFQVYAPRELPEGCRLGATTVRPEQPPGRPGGLEAAEMGQTPWSTGNPCSARTVVEGEGRRLRIKQFLYDWAPPAAGIAPLWESPWLEPVACGEAVGWLGTDYREAPGACVQLHRTQVEVSVLEGKFELDELRALLQGLAPAASDAAEAVRRAPFHQLNYWVRYRLLPYRVPYGLWKYPHRRLYDSGRVLADGELQDLDGVRVLLPPGADYRVDSALLISSLALRHHEVEVLLRRRGAESRGIWISCMREGSEAELPVPPEPETQAAAVREARPARGGTAWYAALTHEHGAREAFWSEDGHRYGVWATPSPGGTEAGFLEMLEALAPP